MWCGSTSGTAAARRGSTETLYHSGLSGDIRAVVLELIERDRLPEIFAAGFSMGGNLVLKMAGEFADAAPREVRGFAAVAPSFDLAACAAELELPKNFLYERHFVTRLKRRMRHKAELFPERYAKGLDGELARVGSVREFDDRITAHFCGFRDAGRLLRAVERYAGDRRDPQADADRDRRGRSRGAVRDVCK